MKNCECESPNLMLGGDDMMRCQLCGGMFTETRRFELIEKGYQFAEGTAWFLLNNNLLETKKDEYEEFQPRTESEPDPITEKEVVLESLQVTPEDIEEERSRSDDA